MQPKRISIRSRSGLVAMLLATMLLIGCSTHARTTSVVVEKRGAAVEEFDADEFIGTPIIGDYDDNPDLDFVLEVVDGDRVFKINVHEDAGEGNQELIENIRRKINFMEDRNTLRVIGYYSSEFKNNEKEYGFLDLKCVVFYEEETGSEEAYFTDVNDSRYYTEGDVTIIYAPGHHYRSVSYPRYSRPWWDTDGDGIPNRYDPWPLSYDTWYDYNLNYIPDWYDPYYVDYYPYWSHWNLSFWAGYNWYTPYYYSYRDPYGYSSGTYYSDYRTYTRLYDRRYVNSTSNPRRYERLDVKTEAYYKKRYRDVPRATSSAAGPAYRTYDAASRPDNRQLVTASSRERSPGSGADGVSAVNSGNDTSRDFNRNRSADYTGPATTRDRNARTRILSNTKRKADSAGTENVRTYERQRTTSVPRAGSDLSRSRGSTTTDERAYRPSASSRNRTLSPGSSSTASGSRTYRGTTSRQRSTSAPADRSRVTGSSRTGSGSSYRGSSASRSRSSGSSTRASSVSRSSSRSRSSGSSTRASSASRSSSRSRPAPSTRSAPSRSRSSTPAPSSARSSGGSSRSRSSSQGTRSSSSGDRRKR